jgi:hypothetical protein
LTTRNFIGKKWELLINKVKEERIMDMGKAEGRPSSLDNQLDLERKRKAMEARIADIRDEFKTEQAEVEKSVKQEKLRQRKVSQDREAMAKIRKAD